MHILLYGIRFSILVCYEQIISDERRISCACA
jgi:hypothetical protein